MFQIHFYVFQVNNTRRLTATASREQKQLPASSFNQRLSPSSEASLNPLSVICIHLCKIRPPNSAGSIERAPVIKVPRLKQLLSAFCPVFRRCASFRGHSHYSFSSPSHRVGWPIWRTQNAKRKRTNPVQVSATATEARNHLKRCRLVGKAALDVDPFPILQSDRLFPFFYFPTLTVVSK